MKKLTLSAATALCLAFAPVKAGAQGIPVYDVSNFTQMIAQINQMAQSYQKQIAQLDEAIRQTSALTGTRDMGSLLNGPLEEELRRYLPNSWEEVLSTIGAEYYSAYSPVSGAEYLPSSPQDPRAQALDLRTSTTYAAMEASRASYDQIERRISTYEALLDRLNNTADLKSSVDLQARIAAENGLLLSELIRLQAVTMQQQAAEDNETLTTYRRAQNANTYETSRAAEAFKTQ